MIERQISFEKACHSADAIQRAAYRFSDGLSIELSDNGETYGCNLSIAVDDEELASVTVHDFRNEVLDQVLRERIRSETAGTRNVILALAFSKSALAQQD